MTLECRSSVTACDLNLVAEPDVETSQFGLLCEDLRGGLRCEDRGMCRSGTCTGADGAAVPPEIKSFKTSLSQLRYAPRDLFTIFSIKFAESTAYYSFAYIYTSFLSDEFGFSDVEAGVLYTIYSLLCSVIGLMVGPLIDALDLRTSLLLGTIPSFIGRLGSALTHDRRVVSMCSYALLPLGAAFGMPASNCARRAPHRTSRPPHSRRHAPHATVPGGRLAEVEVRPARRSSPWACAASPTPRTAPSPSPCSTRYSASPP